MKKVINLGIVLLLVCVVVLSSGKIATVAAAGTVAGTVSTVSTVGTVGDSGSNPTWTANHAESKKSEIPMYLVSPLIPGLNLMSNAVVLSGSAKICYPFAGGQFGWQGQIKMLSGNEWVPLATTVAWVPTTEGRLMACASAPSVGTYALFGYWKPLP